MPYIEGWEWNALAGAVGATPLPDDGWDFVATSLGRAVFRNPGDGVFAKLTARGQHPRMATEASFARWASLVGLPVATLHRAVEDQPVVGQFGVATFWELHRALSVDEVDPQWLGGVLRELHAQEPLSSLPPWRTVRLVSERLKALAACPEVERGVIHRLRQRAARVFADASDVVGRALPVPLHGDAFPDNVVAGPRHPLLVDFELVQVGPGVFDLAPTVVLARRFGYPMERAQRLLNSYGPVDGPSLDAMVALEELAVTCGAIGTYAIDHAPFRDELALRADSLGDGGATPWTSHRVLLGRPDVPEVGQ